jgi:tripeptide aminopeptidase
MSSVLVDLFLDAVRVDAVSLHERAMADFIRSRLAGLPVRIIEDDAGPVYHSDSGNLICIPASFTPERPAVALLAHMDTPRSTASVKPIVTADRISSDGTTALGVDNRAGSMALLQALREHAERGAQGNFIVVFTIGEELGMYGSKHVDLRPYNVRSCFVFDCSKRPGTFIRSAVGSSLYTATFIGKSSHAGVAPEKGINAIHLAAHAMSAVKIGRHSPTMTSNIGMISGGEATNVVPDRCKIDGEVREFDQHRIDEHLTLLQSTFERVVKEHGGSVEFASQVDFPPFVLDPSSDAFRTTQSVLGSLGFTPNPIEYLGGSDANMLNAKGIPSINLGIGAQNPHGNDEFILLEDLRMTLEIARSLIARSAS